MTQSMCAKFSMICPKITNILNRFIYYCCGKIGHHIKDINFTTALSVGNIYSIAGCFEVKRK